MAGHSFQPSGLRPSGYSRSAALPAMICGCRSGLSKEKPPSPVGAGGFASNRRQLLGRWHGFFGRFCVRVSVHQMLLRHFDVGLSASVVVRGDELGYFFV